MGGGEIEARDLAATVAQDADELTFVGDAWTEPADGVGVEVAGDGGLSPRHVGIFLNRKSKKIKNSESEHSPFASS